MIAIILAAYFTLTQAMDADCNCWEHVYFRTSCSYGGYLDESSCHAVNCCYDDTKYGYGMELRPRPICYEKKGRCPIDEQCIIPGLYRDVCGHRAMDRHLCEFRGCCFDQSQYPMCYRPKRETLHYKYTTATIVRTTTTTIIPPHPFTIFPWTTQPRRSTTRFPSTEYTTTQMTKSLPRITVTQPWFTTIQPESSTTQSKTTTMEPRIISTQPKTTITQSKRGTTQTSTTTPPRTSTTQMTSTRHRDRSIPATTTTPKTTTTTTTTTPKTTSLFSSRLAAKTTVQTPISGIPENSTTTTQPTTTVAPISTTETNLFNGGPFGLFQVGSILFYSQCPSNNGSACGTNVANRSLCILNHCCWNEKNKGTNFAPCYRPNIYVVRWPSVSMWSQWGNWGVCNGGKCGTGLHTRNRTCVLSSNGDITGCVGNGIELSNCSNPCPSAWAEWSLWGDCSNSCGQGTKKRTRECTKNGKVIDSIRCPGRRFSVFDTASCNSELCTTWSNWVDGSCSVTCGLGSMSRSRICTEMRNSSHLVPASCRQSITSCQLPGCPVTPTPTSMVVLWGPWSLWSKCSENCGSGLRNRFRQCYDATSGAMLPSNDGKCPGGVFASTETEICNDGYCSVWSTWSAISICSVPCGGGTRRATRTCLVDSEMMAPEVCSTQSEACQTDPCTFR